MPVFRWIAASAAALWLAGPLGAELPKDVRDDIERYAREHRLSASAIRRLLLRSERASGAGASALQVRRLARETLKDGGAPAALEAMELYRALVAEGLDDFDARRAVQKVVDRKYARARRERRVETVDVRPGAGSAGPVPDPGISPAVEDNPPAEPLSQDLERRLREKRLRQGKQSPTPPLPSASTDRR